MNKIHDAFDNIEASEELKSSTMRFLHEQRERQRPRTSYFAWGKSLAAACAVFALFFGICGYTMLTPVSYISIDVNPSLELALNRYDRVISAVAYNEDGEIILDAVNVKGQFYTDAIDTIVDSQIMQSYLTKDSALTFTVAANNSEKQISILTDIENCPSCQRHHGKSYATDISSISAAHESDLSFGKYAAYLVLSQYDSSVTTEDCRGMSMDEIHQQIYQHENDGWHDGYGNGYGNGNMGMHHGYGHE